MFHHDTNVVCLIELNLPEYYLTKNSETTSHKGETKPTSHKGENKIKTVTCFASVPQQKDATQRIFTKPIIE